jgi:ABC-2 type transport system permease protein
VLAVALSVRRDLGSGLVAARPGRAEAPAGSRHPLGLALRLQRGAVVGWAAALVAAGLVYGSVADDVDAMLADNPELADYLARIGGATLADSYLATALRMLALIIAGFAVSSALRNRSEEAAGYAESMLATPVSRWWWAGSHLVVTVVGTLVLLVVCGFATGISYAVSLDDWSRVAPLTLAALATFPSVLVLAGVATLLFGWLPHATVAAWGALVLVAVVDIFGRVLDLPDWMLLLSPFEHAPAVPAESWDALPIVLLSLLACALFALGLVGFRRRDLATA